MENDELISRKDLLVRVEKERAYLRARGLYGAEEVLTKYLRNIVEDMPARSKDFTYNINRMIKVKLTEQGKVVLKQDEARIIDMLKALKCFDNYTCYPEDEDGYTKFQLWDFMRIFGDHFLGFPPLIENNEIIFIDKVD